MDKSALSERDICTKFITPALVDAGWDLQSQIHAEVPFKADVNATSKRFCYGRASTTDQDKSIRGEALERVTALKPSLA